MLPKRRARETGGSFYYHVDIMLTPLLTQIDVCDLVVFGRHGVLPEENKLGQKFLISLSVQADLSSAMDNDDYTQAVCYAELCTLVEDIAADAPSKTPFKLIETLAARIADAVLTRCPRVEEARVTVAKPSAPLPQALATVKVTVTRKRLYRFGIGLGANLGAREAVLEAALDRLACVEGVEIQQVSSFYDSAPWGVEDQPPFVNMAALGVTRLTPHALLNACKETERALGRVPGRRWGERAVDVDILFYGTAEENNEKTLKSRALTLPHPQLFARAFVLEPLVELDPALVISGRRAADALASLARSPGDVMRRKRTEDDE